jgi:2-C-methyl-D-erythritol 2,4-cyclodiphosphate synthase
MDRIGIGHDTHRTAAGGPLRLGGLDIPAEIRLLGHSDADVLLHAITDALLGAVSEGDIGELFPDTRAENAGRDSAEMLQAAVAIVRGKGYEIGNLDCIVFAEKPKLSSYKQAVRASVARILGIAEQCVGIKAKTGEGVGEIGRGEIVSAQCVVILKESPNQERKHDHRGSQGTSRTE